MKQHRPRQGSRFPHGTLTRAIVLRSGVAWVGVRGLLVILGIGFEATIVAVAVVALVGLLGLLDTRILNEGVLLADLGVSRHMHAAVATMPAVLLELTAAGVIP